MFYKRLLYKFFDLLNLLVKIFNFLVILLDKFYINLDIQKSMKNRYQNSEKRSYAIRNVTPESMMCIIASCPSIYEGIRELTPIGMSCIIASCPSSYEAERDGEKVYLIIGRVINPSDAGLEGKVGNGEALIEVPRALIDDKRENH